MAIAARQRVTIDRAAGRLRAVVRHPPHYFVGAFFSVWVAGWAVGEGVALVLVFSGKLPWLPTLAILLWLALWTFAGWGAIWTLAWHVAGREEIELEGRFLSLGVVAWSRRLCTKYDVAAIRGLRHAPTTSGSVAAALGTAQPKDGAIAFEYQGRTIRFGAELGPDDVERVLAMIRERLPPTARGESGIAGASGSARAGT
jgi:hypothetical protein